MSKKENNEITVKVNTSKDNLINILNQKGFIADKTFTLDDYYFVRNNLNDEILTTREIISKCLIIRNISSNNTCSKKITYKIKEYNNNGDIINQSSINCDIYDINQAFMLLDSIGYHQIMNIKENDIIYKKNNFELAIKEIINGDILIEIETIPNSNYDTTDKIKSYLDNLELPIIPNNYFIKKAEIEYNKIKNKKENIL